MPTTTSVPKTLFNAEGTDAYLEALARGINEGTGMMLISDLVEEFGEVNTGVLQKTG